MNRLAVASTRISDAHKALDIAIRLAQTARPAIAIGAWLSEFEGSSHSLVVRHGPGLPEDSPGHIDGPLWLEPGDSGADPAWFEAGAVEVGLLPVYVHGEQRGVLMISSATLSDPVIRATDETLTGGIAINLSKEDSSRETVTTMVRLTAARKRLFQALDQAPITITVTRGPSLRLEFVNDKFVEVADTYLADDIPRLPRALVGRNLADVFAPGDGQREVDVMREVYRTGQAIFRPAVPLYSKQHKRVMRYLDYHVAPLPPTETEEPGVIAHAVDVTKRERAQRAAAQANLRFETLIDSCGAMVRELDPATLEHRFIRGALSVVTGRSLASWSVDWLESIHPDDAVVVTSALRTRPAQEDLFSLDYRLVHSDGGIRWVRDRFSVTRTEAGAPKGIHSVMVEFTAQREAETRLMEVQKLESLELLAGGVAHDFNNLLTGILGIATGLRGELEDEKQQLSADRLIGAARRAADLTRKLLAYSGEGDFEARPLDLAALVADVLPLLQATVGSHIELITDLNDVPPILGDASQMHQVLMNLVVNGAEANEGTDGIVTIAVRYAAAPRKADYGTPPTGEAVLLEIADDGCGMEAATQRQIFQPFFTTKTTGRGLGMAAVLGIVRGHEGCLTVTSAPRNGSIFRIWLPTTQELPALPPAPSAPVSLEGGTVLVIDDEEDVRWAARYMLERLGYSVLTAEDGASGLSIYDDNRDSVMAVLLDLTMPGMYGDEVYRALRERSKDLTIVLSSGYSQREAARRAAGSGDARFLGKPYTLEELAAALRD